MYIPPAPGDDGGAVGAALYISTQLNGKNWVSPGYYCHGMDVQLGPAYTQEEIDFFCCFNGIDARRAASDRELVEETSELIEPATSSAGFRAGWNGGREPWATEASWPTRDIPT